MKGKLEDGNVFFIEVPQGMEHHCWGLAAMRLLKPIYGLKQAVLLLWQRLLEIMKSMGHKQSIADTYMFFSRNKDGKLAIWLSWVDDNLIVGVSYVMKDEGKSLAKEIKIEDVGKLKEFLDATLK